MIVMTLILLDYRVVQWYEYRASDPPFQPHSICLYGTIVTPLLIERSQKLKLSEGKESRLEYFTTMDYNPYAAQINAGVSPFLVQHQMQMTSSCHLHQSHQNQPLQDGFGYPSAGIDYPALNDVMWYVYVYSFRFATLHFLVRLIFMAATN